jgi:ribosomal protein S18 acetylase RimI-like enzyme
VDVRPATEHDFNSVVDIIFGDPQPEVLALAGSPELARRFGAGRLHLHGFPDPTHPTVLACTDDKVLGILQYTTTPEMDRTDWDMVQLIVRVFGLLGATRRARRFYGLTRVQVAAPPGSFYIAELHVDPASRGQGIGGTLLDWATAEAGDDRLMTLHTTTSNPARALYERHGFVVRTTRSHREYKRYTGIEGRHLMQRNPSRT